MKYLNRKSPTNQSLINVQQSNMYFLAIILTVAIQIILINSDAFSVARDCTLENEHYFCGSPCPEGCSSLTKSCQIASYRCVDKCYCNPGYSRDDRTDPENQTCIPTWQCFEKPTCLEENEEFLTGGGFCQNKCSRLNIPCPIQYKLGQSGCYCKEGFARDFMGICIPEESCPKEKCEDMYEVYTSAECDITCKNLGVCKQSGNLKYKSGCYCERGFFRDPEGNCTQKRNCPKYQIKK